MKCCILCGEGSIGKHRYQGQYYCDQHIQIATTNYPGIMGVRGNQKFCPDSGLEKYIKRRRMHRPHPD